MPLTEIQRQLLGYLADQPQGRGLVCEPHLAREVERLVLRGDQPRLLHDVYEGPDGCFVASISDAGRAAIAVSES